MTTFTREQLVYWSQTQPLAAFALAQIERAEKAESERDDANDERDDAVDRWARRAREAEAELDASEKEAKMYAARALAAEGRLAMAEAELSDLEALHELMSKAWRRADQRWLAQDPEHRSMKRPDLTDQFIWMMEQIDKVEAERDRLKKELEEAEDVINALYDWAYAQTWTQEDDAIVHYVTPEMAHDAGDPSMTGSPIYGKVSCEFCLAESGEPWRDLMDSNAAVCRARERKEKEEQC